MKTFFFVSILTIEATVIPRNMTRNWTVNQTKHFIAIKIRKEPATQKYFQTIMRATNLLEGYLGGGMTLDVTNGGFSPPLGTAWSNNEMWITFPESVLR